jgi:two-component system chemotaxis response regulator CheB
VPNPTVSPAARLGRVIVEAVEALQQGSVEKGDPVMYEPRMGEGDDPAFLSADEVRLTRMSCPECNGGLAETDVSGLRYYRCHVGHQYSPQSLEAAQRESVEAKLWAAAAALEEHAALARHLATSPGRALGDDVVDGYRRLADRSTSTARALVAQLQDGEPVAPPLLMGDGSAAQAP